MPLEEFNLNTPWDNNLHQVEMATRDFWQNRIINRNYGRLQDPGTWWKLRWRLRDITKVLEAAPLTPLTPYEIFLLHAATHLYEVGWQAPNTPRLPLRERYAESGRMIRASFDGMRKELNFGLSGLESRTVETLARICEAMGWVELTSLNAESKPAGYGQRARLRYLVALLQLADFLVIDRTRDIYFHTLVSLDLDDMADARLVLHHYITYIDLKKDSLAVHFTFHPDDKDLAPKMSSLFEEPIRKWLASNREWLYRDFGFYLELKQPNIDIAYQGLSPVPLSETCKALVPFLEKFQPSPVQLPLEPAPLPNISEPSAIQPAGPPHLPSMMDVGIIFALKEEFAELYNEVEKRCVWTRDSENNYYYLFEHPSADSTRRYWCVATFVGEMGSVKAGLMTQRLISEWKPRTLVMLGIAAALSNDTLLGDVIIASQIDAYLENSKAIEVTYRDGYAFTFSGEVYRSSIDLLRSARNFEFANRQIFQDWQLRCSYELRQLLLKESLEKLIASKLLRDKVQMIDGHLASGPTVGASQAFKNWLKTRDRKYLALEMEAAGLMAAVYDQADPKRTLVLRAISDYGDERKQQLDEMQDGAFRRYAIHNAIQLLWKFLDAGILPHVQIQGLLDNAGK